MSIIRRNIVAILSVALIASLAFNTWLVYPYLDPFRNASQSMTLRDSQVHAKWMTCNSHGNQICIQFEREIRSLETMQRRLNWRFQERSATVSLTMLGNDKRTVLVTFNPYLFQESDVMSHLLVAADDASIFALK